MIEIFESSLLYMDFTPSASRNDSSITKYLLPPFKIGLKLFGQLISPSEDSSIVKLNTLILQHN